MKTKEFMNGIADMSMAELNDELVAAKKELFNLRFQNATNQLDNTSYSDSNVQREKSKLS